MKVLLDCDVLLDVALARAPHLGHSADVLRWAEAGGTAAVAWHTLTNCAYLLKGSGRSFLTTLLRFVSVAPAGTVDAHRALRLPMRDLEDAFLSAAALSWGAEFIITRNINDYRRSPVPAITPTAFMSRLP